MIYFTKLLCVHETICFTVRNCFACTKQYVLLHGTVTRSLNFMFQCTKLFFPYTNPCVLLYEISLRARHNMFYYTELFCANEIMFYCKKISASTIPYVLFAEIALRARSGRHCHLNLRVLLFGCLRARNYLFSCTKLIYVHETISFIAWKWSAFTTPIVLLREIVMWARHHLFYLMKYLIMY